MDPIFFYNTIYFPTIRKPWSADFTAEGDNQPICHQGNKLALALLSRYDEHWLLTELLLNFNQMDIKNLFYLNLTVGLNY